MKCLIELARPAAATLGEMGNAAIGSQLEARLREAREQAKRGFDPFRGVDIGPPPRSRPTTRGLHCPACHGPMAIEYERGVQIHRCAACNGLWLAPEGLEELAESVSVIANLSLGELRQQMSKIPLRRDISYRKCPCCDSVMTRRNFGGRSGIITDECRRHGVFLDPGEFEAIETYIRLGGRRFDADLQERTKPADGFEKRASTPGDSMVEDITFFSILKTLFRL